MVEAQILAREPADLQLVSDVAGAEGAGGEADKGGKHDEDDVEIVNEQVGGGRGSNHKQGKRRNEGE